MEGVRRIVGQFVSQLNAQLSGQMTTLGHTMDMVSQGQLQTQKNLQNTLNAAQAMAADAQTMQTACAQMAQSLQSWVDDWKSSRPGAPRSLRLWKSRTSICGRNWSF